MEKKQIYIIATSLISFFILSILIVVFYYQYEIKNIHKEYKNKENEYIIENTERYIKYFGLSRDDCKSIDKGVIAIYLSSWEYHLRDIEKINKKYTNTLIKLHPHIKVIPSNLSQYTILPNGIPIEVFVSLITCEVHIYHYGSSASIYLAELNNVHLYTLDKSYITN